MKRLLFFFLLLPSLSWGQDIQTARLSPAIEGGGVASGCSYTSKDSASGTGGTLAIFGNSGTYDQAALSYTSTDGYTVKRLAVSLKRIGTGGFTTVTVKLCSNNETGPVPQTCTSVGTITVSEIDDADFETFTIDYGTGYSISTGTRYWVAYAANGTGDASNHVMANAASTGTESRASSDELNDTSWTNRDTSATGNFTVYSCD